MSYQWVFPKCVPGQTSECQSNTDARAASHRGKWAEENCPQYILNTFIPGKSGQILVSGVSGI